MNFASFILKIQINLKFRSNDTCENVPGQKFTDHDHEHPIKAKHLIYKARAEKDFFVQLQFKPRNSVWRKKVSFCFEYSSMLFFHFTFSNSKYARNIPKGIFFRLGIQSNPRLFKGGGVVFYYFYRNFVIFFKTTFLFSVRGGRGHFVHVHNLRELST